MGFLSSVAAIIGIVAAPFTGGLSLVLTAAAIVAPKIVDSALDFVMKPFMGNMGIGAISQIGGAAEAERQQGILVQRQGSVSNIPVVYGYRKVGDIITFAETGSTDNKYLWVAHVLSEGTIAGLRNLYIDDYQISDDVVKALNAGSVVNVGSGKYKDRVRLQLFKGVYWTDPTPINHPVRSSCFFNTDSARPPNWTSDMVYNGLAVIFARYEWKKIVTQEDQDNNPFGYSIPKITVEMFGKLLSPVPATAPANEYDGDTARYEIITTGSGQTIGYTNPVEVLLDYLRNPRYGKGLKNADIDWASWYIAAQKCRTEVTYVSGIKGPIMSMNFVLDTSSTLFNNVKTILSNFRGYMPYVQGKYKLKIEDAGHPTDITSGSAEVVAQFNASNIVGEITYSGIERTSKYNQMVVTWVDPDNKWSNQEVVYPETEEERQVYINQDGGRENKGTFTASGITNAIMAKDLARILFWKSRVSDTVSLNVSTQGMELEPGDCIHVAGNILNFNTTYPWRVVSSTLNNDMTVTLGCVFVPDYIFPYTRWGEPDRVLPVYVPKGAERYYPVILPSEKNGLLPPYPGKPTSGLGSVSALSDVVLISKINFVSMGTGPIDETSQNIYADVYFGQPNNTLYSSTKFYWKEDVASETAWLESESVLRPGPGKEIIARLGPVVFGKNYVLNTRVAYASGEVSSQMGVYRFTVSAQGVIPTPPVGTPGVPGTPGSNNPENFFASVTAVTLLDGVYPNTHPRNPRQIEVTLRQDMALGTNNFLNAVEIFYKPSANAKWKYIKNPLSVSQGSDITFILNLGVPVYPLRPGYNNEAPAKVDDYDFIFRFAYSDGQVSKYQWHATNVSVEWNGITWGPFNPFALTGMGTVIVPKEPSANYTPIIEGPSDIVDTRYIEISSPYSIRDNGYADDGIRFFFYPPVEADRANWRGVRVYRHKAGALGTGDYVDFTPPTSSGGFWSFFMSDITYDDTWEYVVTCLVIYGDTVVEANRGQYIVGKVHSRSSDADYPSDANWRPSFRVDALETLANAKAKLGTAPASPPRQDTYLASFSSSTVLDGSMHPSVPRRLSFTFTQSLANGVNGRINKYVIYYKQADNQYWKKSVYNLTSYTEGTPVTIDSTATTPPMDLAYPSYPNFPGRDQYFDFVVRFGYDNGMESTYEHAWLNTSIENRGSSTEDILQFSPLLPSVNNARRSSQVLTTEDKAPPGAVLDVRDILTSTSMYPLALEVMDPPTKGNVLRFGFAIPIAQLKSYLAGFRILRRDVVNGYTTQYVVDDSNVPYKMGEAYINNAYVNIISAWSKDTVWHKEYEWAVIPLVWYQGAKTEANNAIYWRGKVCDTYNTRPSNPWVSNWYSKKPAEVMTTTAVRNKLALQFPSNGPVARMLSITRTNPDYALTGGEAFGYWTIKYQVPDNFVSMRIYRRFCRDYNSNAAGTSGKYQGDTNFGDAGQWEIIDINNTNNPITVEDGYKTQVVNLRPAIADYFNDKSLQYGYDLSKPKDTVTNQNNTMYWMYQTTPPTTAGNTALTKYWLAGDTQGGANQPGKITQLLMVMTTNISGTNTVSINALRVDLYNQRYINNVWVRNADGDPYIDAGDIPFAEVEASLDKSAITGITVDASWTTLLRKPSEGIPLVPDSKIKKPGQSNQSITYTKPIATPGVL